MQIPKRTPRAVLIGMALVSTTFCVFAQTKTATKTSREILVAEIDRVISDAVKLQDPLLLVKLKASAAGVLWRQEPERARSLLMEVFDYSENQKEPTFERELARSFIVQTALGQDRQLAEDILKKIRLAEGDNPATVSSEKNRLARLSYRLIDDDANLGASILEQSMSEGVPPAAMAPLAKLRERNPLLANQVVSRAISNLATKPSNVGITGLGFLSSYLYPVGVFADPLPEVTASDEELRRLFFRIGYEVVKSIESKGPASSLGPAFTQFAVVSATLREMSRQYAPILFVELNTIAEEALKVQPPQIADLIRTQAAMINRTFLQKGEQREAEISMMSALSRGDFAEAEKIISEQKDENRAKALLELLRRAQVQYYLKRSDLYSALAVAKKIENVEGRVAGLIDIARTAIIKKDSALANTIAGDIQVTPLNDDLKGIRVRSLLRASIEFEDPTSFTLAQEAVKILNTLPSVSAEERRTRRSPQDMLNDPSSMLDSSEMARSFGNIGQRDFNLGVSASDKIQHPAVRLFARLALVKGALGTKAVTQKMQESKKTGQD